jgi:MoxR-like ATPase
LVAANILRHRLILSFEAEADEVNVDQVIKKLLEVVAVP